MIESTGRSPDRSAASTPPNPDFAGGLAYDVTGAAPGTAPAVVLLHGLGSSRAAFAQLRGLVGTAATVYAVDLPGHGDSPAPVATVFPPTELAAAVGRWLDALGIDRAHLVGNSLGGWTALELAADGRAESVVGLAPAGLWDGYTSRSPILNVNRAMARMARPWLRPLVSSRVVRRITFASAVERLDLLTTDVALAAAYAQADSEGYEACNDGMLHRRFERAAKIDASVPVTVVFGDRDRLLPAPANQVRALAPAHAEWEIYYRCGHAPMWDAPEHTLRTMRRTGGW